MNLRELVAVATSSLLALAVLAGCSSGNSVDKFCSVAMSAQQVADDDIDGQVAKLREMAKAAPDRQLADDITVMADAWKALASGDQADLEAVTELENQFDGERLSEADANIRDQVPKLCPGVDLG